MDNTTIPIGGWLCPGCNRIIRTRSSDGMLYWHRDTARKVGDQEAPWCPYGGVLWDLSARVGPNDPEASREPLPAWVMAGQAGRMGTEMAGVNPRRVREHLWRGTEYPVRLPGSFFSEEATPPGEGLQSYAWLGYVTDQLYPFVRSVTQAYRIAKMLHQSRWPEGTPELPAGTLVRRRLEREAGA